MFVLKKTNFQSNNNNMVWNKQTEEYINNLLDKAQQHQWIHTTSEKYFSKRNNIFTIVSLSLTSLTGTLTFITSNNKDNFHANLVIGSILYVSTVLTGIQKFMNYETLAEKHKNLYKKYMELENYIQNQLLLDEEEREDAKIFQTEISTKLKEIVDDLPMIPNHITKEFEEKRRKIQKEPITIIIPVTKVFKIPPAIQ